MPCKNKSWISPAILREGLQLHGLNPADVRRIWGEVFTHYRGLSSTHLFSLGVKVFGSGAQLPGKSPAPSVRYGTRVTLDS